MASNARPCDLLVVSIVVGWSLPSAMFAEFLVAWPPTGGDPLWTQTLANGGTGSIMAVAANAGGLAVVGKRNGVFGARQLTSAGEPVWASDACTGKNGRDVAIDSQGDIVVIGDGDGPTAFSIRLCKFTPDGTLRWGKDIDGGFGTDLGYAVAIDAEDRIIAGGAMAGETQLQDPCPATALTRHILTAATSREARDHQVGAQRRRPL